MKTVITDKGIDSIIKAGLNGPLVKVTTVKIGNTILQPLSSMTDVSNLVWSGNYSYITYKSLDSRTFMFTITLDESVGDFSVGNIGLFLEDGSMFSITTLITPESKIASSSTQVGNRRTYEVPVVMSGLSDLLDVSILNVDEAAIPTTPEETNLPDPNASLFPVYEIEDLSSLKQPALALRTTNAWKYVIPTTPESINCYENIQIGEGVSSGKTVYYNVSTQKFELTTENSSYDGIWSNFNQVINSGSFSNSSFNLTPGVKYYSGINGILTAIENKNYVGIATDINTILLQNNIENKNNKVASINQNTPIYTYPTTQAVTTYVAEKINSATNDILSTEIPLDCSKNSGTIGISDTAARADHTHKIISGSYFSTCSTASNIPAKVVSGISNFQLIVGNRITVQFLNTNTSTDITLNVNSTGAKPIYVGNYKAGTGCFNAGDTIDFIYDGTNWRAVNWIWVKRNLSGSSYFNMESSGKIVQGGLVNISADSMLVPYNLPFSTAVLKLTTDPYNRPSNLTTDTNYLCNPINITLTGFNALYRDSDTSGVRTGYITWEATGY